jgi:hypothetical protein
MDGFGRYLAWAQGSSILQANVKGRHHVHRIARGHTPAMTSGGHFVFYARGSEVFLNVHKKAVAACPSGTPTDIAGSPHGNYALYACSTGGIYVGYAGAQ